MKSGQQTIPGYYLVDGFLRAIHRLNDQLNQETSPTLHDVNNMLIALNDLLKDKTYDTASKNRLIIENILGSDENLRAIERVYQLTAGNTEFLNAKNAIEKLHAALKILQAQMVERTNEKTKEEKIQFLVKALENCVNDPNPQNREKNINNLALKLLALTGPDKNLYADVGKLLIKMDKDNPQAGYAQAIREAYDTSELLTKPQQKSSTAMIAKQAPALSPQLPARETAQKNSPPPPSREATATHPKADWKAQETAQKEAAIKPAPKPEREEEVKREEKVNRSRIIIGNR